MPYVYLDHVADIGLEATGETFESALQDAGQGLLDLLVDADTVQGRLATTISAVADDPDALFIAFLNAILAEQDIKRWFFHSIRVDGIEETGGVWRVKATLWGEPIDLERHQVGNEVKAATYSGLDVDIQPGRVSVRCVLDI